MWTLIIVVLSIESIALTSIPGFQTEQACMTAARAWVKQMDATQRTRGQRALCVKS